MYHKVIVLGRLGRDPEMRYLPSGQAVTDLSVASDRVYKDAQGEWQTETTWWRVSVWGARVESCNAQLKKGARVLLEGQLRPDENGGPRIWTRQDGTTGASYEMTAYQVTFVDTRREREALGAQLPAPGAQMHDQGEYDDDIPF